MADVLSQSQIDALLNSMQNPEAEKVEKKPEKPKENYRKYDFYSPKKYTKDKLKMLRSIYDNYARIATSQINGLFRIASEVEVVGVEEQRYYEFGNALNETDVITLTKIDLHDHSKNPPMLFHISPSLMGAMIDRILGGTGSDSGVDASYAYTDIELALYEKIIRHLVGITSDVWASHIKFDVVFDRVEENPSMFQGISVDETVVIIMLNIQMNEVTGGMNICIPGTLLFNMFDIIDKTKHLADEDSEIRKRDSRNDLMENIKKAKMDITAQLGTARLNVDDLYNLHVGDVIDLNKPQNSEVTVQVEGQPWFMGKLGVYNKNMAVKIENRVKDTKENLQESLQEQSV